MDFLSQQNARVGGKAITKEEIFATDKAEWLLAFKLFDSITF